MTRENTAMSQQAAGGIGFFEKWLSAWVALCIVAGVSLGNMLPGLFASIARIEYASVNLVVAILIWAMVYPMMVNVDFTSLRHIGDKPKGLIVTLIVNWLIKPFTMAGLGILFFEVVFADLIAPADAQQYIAGLILLGAAPCTAMVFVWSQMTRGDATYTLVQVSMNDVIMIFAFAPIVALLVCGDPIDRRGADTQPAGTACETRREQRGSRCPVHQRGKTALGDRLAGNRRAAVWVSGTGHLGPARIDSAHRRTAVDPVLWYIRCRLYGRLGIAHPVQHRCALRPDRHIQFFRTGGRGRHQPVWA
jgi:hypothetical protein